MSVVRPAVPDPPELSDVLWRDFAGAVGWDVGSNCGQAIVEMSWSFDRIEGFEPSPDSYEYAVEHVRNFLPGFHIRLHQMAVSDRNGEVELAYPAAEQKETGQLVTVGTAGMEWEPANWDKVEKLTVPARTADSIAVELGWPDFMKVDTEGHEHLVLLGARDILARGETDMLVEFHTPGNRTACWSVLSEAGYRLETVRHPHYPHGSHMWQQHGWIRAFAPKGVRGA